MASLSVRMKRYTRSEEKEVEAPYEKVVIVPEEGDSDPAHHAWADARFATDIMSEHALFFALLMPKELAAQERDQALEFSARFGELNKLIDDSPPPAMND